LPAAFYDRPTLDVARDLLGKVLVHDAPAGHASGVIVETEAYIGEADPACHAAAGRTERNAPLYGKPGVAYVYLNYGLHYLVNAVTEAEGRPAAVLLRALAPLEGLDLMWARRGLAGAAPQGDAHVHVCRGPGNLTRALGISLGENRLDLTQSRLSIEDRGLAVGPIAWSPRIGIRVGTSQWWRAFVRDHPAVSGPRSYHDVGLARPRSVPGHAAAAAADAKGYRRRATAP
jgi:DNA-3-methyladenine glycosylase